MKWPTGGRRLTSEEREEILRVFENQSLEAATELATSRGLSPWYAYKLAHERGLMPRASRHWGKHREELA